MQRTNIYLEERQTRALNRLATAAGVSRAEMLRRILDRGLAGEADTLVTATAREIHYRKDSGVLVLNGEPVLKAGNQTLKATGTGAMIKIRLATGAVGVDGQAQWSAD